MKEAQKRALNAFEQITLLIQHDFKHSNVSYVFKKDIRDVLGYNDGNRPTMKAVKKFVRKEFDASLVSVGNKIVALVKRTCEDVTTSQEVTSQDACAHQDVNTLACKRVPIKCGV